jgi:hypothetical protein
MVSSCISCRAQIDVGKDPIVGQQFQCPSCSDTMEVVWLDPVELDWPAFVEDYDEDEDEDKCRAHA